VVQFLLLEITKHLTAVAVAVQTLQAVLAVQQMVELVVVVSLFQ
jgi:hypothetical protein